MMRALFDSPALARSRQYAAAHRAGANVPRRWTLITASHSSAVMFTSMRSRRMPALLISTSRRPNDSTAVLMRRWAPSQSATLSPLATASPPIALISSTTSWAGPGRLAGAVHLAAEVVHDDLGAVLREHQGVLAADAPGPSRHDRDSSLAQPSHGAFPLVVGPGSRECPTPLAHCSSKVGGGVRWNRDDTTS